LKLATRPPFERIAALDRALRAGRYPNARTIADELETSGRTVRRDIEFMRERMEAPIAFDPRRNGYYYADPTYRLSLPSLTEGELVALFLAERVLRQYRGTPYAPELARAFRKITAGLTDEVSFDTAHLDDSFSFRTSAAPPFDPAVFRELAGAIRGKRRVAIEYWSASRDETARREVDPYHLACVDGQWYLIGHCHLRGDVRMFAPGRIRSLEATDLTFDVSPGFRPADYLADTFAVMRGGEGEIHRVLLRFTGEAARYVREREWHPSQRLEEDSAAGLLLRIQVSHLREVEKWALAWGPGCEVLEPTELRDRVARAASAAAALYIPAGANGKEAVSEPRRRGGAARDEVRRCP
jgi:predicted DNA-binding transcriptional regulator YafY